ncbi:MAG: PQQ-dependent sugar dehydrogenase [Verrucomicrobiae bacterium]|nr:PQQ-dependent sugar dehydrogenase [Verrucomicrobiae bacterium]
MPSISNRITRLAATAVTLLPVSGIAQEDPAPTREALATMKVEALYASLCAQCHGKNLEGGMAPSFLDGEWKHGSTDAEIAQTILKGNIQFGMTPWEGILSDDQIRSMVIFIREKERVALNEGITFPKPEPGKVTKTDHESYLIETVIDEGKLEIPWAIAFLPDGSKLVTERAGRLRLIDAAGNLHPDPIKGTPEVMQLGQGGLLEVATHPDYSSNGWIYLGFADGWKEGVDSRGRPKMKALTAVVRGRIKDHTWVDQEWIWKGDKKFYTDAGPHFGTRFVFDQGFLYFIVGERGGNMEAQDLGNPKGKIFRVHDDGRIPTDNPTFAGAKTTPLPGLWSAGHRNPQGMDIDPRDSAIYSTEHGPRGGDELNRILPGHNYGWPVITYGMNYDGTPMTSKTHEEGMDQPLTYWVPSIATCGLDFYTGDKFPNWKNDLLVGALKNQEIRRLRIVDGKVTEQEVIMKDLGRVRDVADGPDGSIYVLLNGPDSIVRIVPVTK